MNDTETRPEAPEIVWIAPKLGIFRKTLYGLWTLVYGPFIVAGWICLFLGFALTTLGEWIHDLLLGFVYPRPVRKTPGCHEILAEKPEKPS